MPTDDSKPTHSFEDLEKQLAKDTLEKALKDLHGEINKDIEKNKKTFSEEIQRTLEDFKEELEESVSEEMDKKLSSLFEKHFKETSLQVKGSFEEIFDPVLKTTQDDMNRLQSQGESTLRSWKGMMAEYESLWTRPFILVFFASAFTGMLIFLISIYFLWSTYSETIKGYETRLTSNENLLLWYFEKYKESPEYIEAEKQKQGISSHLIIKPRARKKRSEPEL
ncbi:MAG: hypothetical protein KA112_05110 [Alphaproteobacteria bacterium]|nr:hypothetical protein [Alphaproteobacteria bacterium]